MEVTIKVSQGEADTVVRLGLKPWNKFTDEEIKEWNHLMNLFGTAVVMKVLYK